MFLDFHFISFDFRFSLKLRKMKVHTRSKHHPNFPEEVEEKNLIRMAVIKSEKVNKCNILNFARLQTVII